MPRTKSFLDDESKDPFLSDLGKITESNDDDETDETVKDIDLKVIQIDKLSKYSDQEVVQIVNEKDGNDNIQVVSYGMKVIFINDHQGNFLPVFGISLSQLFYHFGFEQDRMEGNTKLSSNMSYYNALVGTWEPIVE